MADLNAHDVVVVDEFGCNLDLTWRYARLWDGLCRWRLGRQPGTKAGLVVLAGDLGALQLPLGIGLLLAAREPTRYHVVVLMAATANLLHAGQGRGNTREGSGR